VNTRPESKFRPEGKIVKAAILVGDKTYVGWRHADIRNEILETTDISREDIARIMHDEWKVGFITENGRFLTRKQALIYGRVHGQITEIAGSVLTSEDLWDNEGREHK
jgi:plasmid maintenance system antidote protein VapI